MRIIDAISEAVSNNRPFYCMEFFPPHTEAGTINLYSSLQRMAASPFPPLFCGVTWGDFGATANETLQICSAASRLLSVEMQVHVTGAGASAAQMRAWVQAVRRQGLQNVFLLRGARERPVHHQRSSVDVASPNSPTAAPDTPSTEAMEASTNVPQPHKRRCRFANIPSVPSTGTLATAAPTPVTGGVTPVTPQQPGSGTSDGSSPKSPSAATPATASAAAAGASTLTSVTTASTPLSAPAAAAPAGRTTGTSAAAAATPHAEGLHYDPASPFKHAVDLVRFVRTEFGPEMNVCVAAYPEGHPDAVDGGATLEERRRREIEYLKEKVSAGANLVVTQVIFDAAVFIAFIRECRAAGIMCPILPSVLPLHSYAQFRRFRAQRELAGMDALDAQLRLVSTADDVAVRGVATKFTAGIVRTLMRSGVRGVYFVTQNLIAPTRAVLQELDLLNGSALTPAVAAPERPLPWRTSGNRAEMARPIYWSARPQSYIHRTAAARRSGATCGTAARDDERAAEVEEDVDEGSAHPNGRWGSAHSAAFHQDKHNYLLINAAARKCAAFRDVRTIGDVCWAFVAFLNGQGSLPWCAEGLAPEASHILQSVLVPMNTKGLLTINSQPAVNGARSDDAEVGWGPRGGRVYQRQYLEFFCSPAALNVALQIFDEHPSLTYMAQNRERKGRRTNMPDGDAWVRARPASDDQLLQHVAAGAGSGGAATAPATTTAPTTRFAGMEAVVTWGVFPNRDILQPTTVSSDAFDIWVPEAFEQWLLSFAEGHVPRVVHDIVDTWYLVTVFDNDFTTAPNTAMNAAVQQLLQRLPNLCERERVPTSASDEDALAFSNHSLQRPNLVL